VATIKPVASLDGTDAGARVGEVHLMMAVDLIDQVNLGLGAGPSAPNLHIQLGNQCEGSIVFIE
jgi:hypothetical protein